MNILNLFKSNPLYVYGLKCHATRRLYSSKKFSATLNLPTTKFQLSMKDVSNRESVIQKDFDFQDVYLWQSKQNRENKFVLHDGPPYANGDPHVGHALNKILKDITTRYHLLKGDSVHYVPGWDCHGMPIEQKALANVKIEHNMMNPLTLRKKAKTFAEKAIKKQMASFKRWGVMADWNNCYYTFDKLFEAKQLGVFLDMFEKGLIYQDYMPVQWSPAANTALAEAELEYNENHCSISVYVSFPLVNIPEHLACYSKGQTINLLIWTTTPWTVPLNQAICCGPSIEYQLVETGKELYLIGANFREKFETISGTKTNVLTTCKGKDLTGMTYRHPLKRDESESPVICAHHVTLDKGTGLVHTAPAHGPDDFRLALAENLSLDCHVDESGRYMPGVHEQLTGQSVLSDGNKTVLSLLAPHIVHQETFTHSYPYDWRTKTPCIYRASKQWFVDTSKIKDKALDALSSVSILSGSVSDGMRPQLQQRNYWCISRQRVWGLPIPAFVHKQSKEILINKASIQNMIELVREHGSDCWWTLPIDTLLPPHIKQQSGFNADDEFEKGGDVLDIWFDSGSTWATVLQDVGRECDVYMEGLDQYGGWFQSSLLTSVAVQDKAPYKKLVVHGFTVDEEGRKMSKSLGNVVDPDVIVNGGKNKNKEPAYGADVLRWWVASVGLDTRVSIGSNALKRCQDQVYSARKSMRYLLGNLYDFDKDEHIVEYCDLMPSDQYMLSLLYDFLHKVNDAYESFAYDHVIRLCDLFVTSDVSAFYSSATKHRMYCLEAESPERRAAQTVQYLVLEALCKALAPVVPHLCEELYQHEPLSRPDVKSVFQTSWCNTHEQWNNSHVRSTINAVLDIRNVFYKHVQPDVPVACDVIICSDELLINILHELESDRRHSTLCELLGVSHCTLSSAQPESLPDNARTCKGTCIDPSTGESAEFTLLIRRATDYICERCRRYTSTKYGTPCDECMQVMANGWE